MKTTPIKAAKADLEAAAAEALGGEPTKPPVFPTQPIGRAEPDTIPQGNAPARVLFTRAVETAAAAPAFGNPTLDGMPPELVMRRSKVGTVRRSLADLARRVKDDQAALTPMLDDLADDAEALQAAEMFEVAVARKFLADLSAVVDALATEKPAETAAPAEIQDPSIGIPTED